MKKLKIFLALAILVMSWPQTAVNAASMSATVSNQTLTEGGSATGFQIRLSARPNSGNNVSVSWSTNEQCLIASEGRGFTASGQVITTSDNVELSAKANDDSTQESNHSCSVTYRTASADSNLHNLSLNQNFNITDNNDPPASTKDFYGSVLGPSSITEGTTAIYSFGVGPTTKPRDSLIISASTTDGQCQLVSGGQVTDYVEQTIPAGVQGSAIFTVRAINDSDVESDHSCTVLHSLRTNDTEYSGLTINNTQVPIIDDEARYSSEAVDNEQFLQRPELGLLDSVDANNDGTEDKQQRNLGVFINAISGRRQAIEATGIQANCNAISTPDSKTEDDMQQQSNDFHYPHGLIGFRVICDSPGATANIKLYLDNLYQTDDIEIQKYSNKTGYTPIDAAKITKFETQNGPVTLITYDITDGGELDEDGQANGTITDPVGIAISAVEPQSNVIDQINNAESSNKTKQILFFATIPALAITVFFGLEMRKRYLRNRSKMR